MTYLEIFQEALVLAGIVQTPPSTAQSQTGEYALMLRNINQAYSDIQTSRENWRFMWGQFTATGADGSDVMTMVTSGVSKILWNSCIIYETALGTTDKTKLDSLSYSDWLDYYRGMVIDESRPNQITTLPSGAYRLTPTADKAYTITGDYYKINDIMSADADVPVFPVKFHPLIVYAAVQKNGKFIQDEFKAAANKMDYDILFDEMLWEELLEDDNAMVVVD